MAERSRTERVKGDAAALAAIRRAKDVATTEAVARALDLYAAWLSLKPGTLAEVSAHTRRKTP